MSDTPQAASLATKSRLIKMISGGPTLHDTASTLLRKALLESFPKLQIDPDNAVLMTPLWRQQGDEVISISSRFETLAHALGRMAFTQERANYIEGEHFLTLTPNTSEPIHLPVSMDAITTLLNECARVLFSEFAQNQLDYWNETATTLPRWQSLADTLKNALDVQSVSGWDAQECSLARLVAQHPEKTSRATANGFSNVRACLLDIDVSAESAKDAQPRHLMIGAALVLTATIKDRELIVMYSISDGYESFSSLAQLSASLPGRLNIDLTGQQLKWRFYEPDTNVFDAMVWALISTQVDAIDSFGPDSRSPLAGFSPTEEDSRISAQDKQHVEQLENAVPAWLSNGSIYDLQAYSGYVTELGNLLTDAENVALEGNEIALIQTYAQQQMRDAILAERITDSAADLHLDDVRITITHSFEVGGFTLPDARNVSVETLGEFALRNVPPFSATVAYSDGTAVPQWMTVELLLRLSNTVNVGETYPQLIKRTLVDDPVQAQRHAARYRLEMPVLLPLLALECKLKRQGNVDDSGYRLVCTLMQSMQNNAVTDESPVQIRPLAFLPRYRFGSTPDTVANMYIIGPGKGRHGPCLLYRPLLDQPLRQFASEQNMLYAFYQMGELRDSILAWLPTRAISFEYAQYVFSSGIPSPWTVFDLALEPFMHLNLSAPVELADSPLGGDILYALYAENSQAMVELADRQSTSNAERRWALLADTGWAIFSVAANFLSGPAGTAVWIWQSISEIQQAVEAAEHGDSVVAWSSVGEVLLTLGIVLTQRVAARRLRRSNAFDDTASRKPASREETPAIAPPPAKALRVTFDAAALNAELPAAHLGVLSPVGMTRSHTGAAFLARIEQLKVAAPSLPAGARPNARHLHELKDKLYAEVGKRWFQVSAEADEPVFVVDPNDPAFPGLGLKYDAVAARWHWDLKLRLRGGGRTGKIDALRREKTRVMEQTWTALNRFIEQEATRKASVDEVLAAPEHSDPTAPMSQDAIDRYIARTEEVTNAYGQALMDLETWREAGGAGVFYQSQLMRFTIELHRYGNGWARMKLIEYAKIVAPYIDPTQPSTASRAERMHAAQLAINVSDEMLARLGQLQTSLERLMGHRGVTRKVAGDLQKIARPLSEHDLKANEISMSSELCLVAAMDDDVGPLRQSLIDTLENAADAGHSLVERRKTPQPLSVETLTALVDRLADAERRLEELHAQSAAQLKPERFARVQALVAEFHQLAIQRLLKLLPEPDDIPLAQLARLEPVPSTSRAIGKVSRSRPRVVEAQKPPEPEPQASAKSVPVIKKPFWRPGAPQTVDDREIIANGMSLSLGVDAFISGVRTDAQRPSRIPADMKDLLDQQAARLDQAAKDVAEVYARKSLVFPVATLSEELRAAAVKTRREGINVYGAMLIKRRPREAYLQWLHEHDLITITKDPRGRIKTKQRRDYFQEYAIHDKARPDQALWVAHFHYGELTDPDQHFTAAHLKFADAHLKALPAKSRQVLETFDALDNALRRIINPAARDLFLTAEPAVASDA